MTANHSHCIHNWPVTREIGNSFIFRRVVSARCWHDALRPLLRIARFLLASWPVQRSSVEVTSKFRCGFSRHQPLLENLTMTPRFAFSAQARRKGGGGVEGFERTPFAGQWWRTKNTQSLFSIHSVTYRLGLRNVLQNSCAARYLGAKV